MKRNPEHHLARFIPAVLASALTGALLSGAALAHDLWIEPSATVLSGEEARITFDAAAGNTKFVYDHRPLGTDNVRVIGPDGKSVQVLNPHTGSVRSSFDLLLKMDGTYRVAIVNAGVFASWKENGENKRWRGSAADFAKNVPKNATELRVTESAGRIETFVTKGKPSAVKTTGAGMEMVVNPHPNDLYAGETAVFTLLMDGKPAPDREIEVVGGSRYRDEVEEMTLKTDSKGQFSIKWPRAGLFWVHSDMSDTKTSVPQASRRNVSYVGTFEVLPQ